jgi:hypothetical protein
LNGINEILGTLPAFVVRPNEFAPLPFDAPHRFLLYGVFKARGDITISPTVEIRSGYPFSLVDQQLDFVGGRDRAGRFPLFLSVDAQVTKGFTVPAFVPMLEGHRARFGVAVFNITNHFNPVDVQQNTGSPFVGRFFNSRGTSVRGKFEFDF